MDIWGKNTSAEKWDKNFRISWLSYWKMEYWRLISKFCQKKVITELGQLSYICLNLIFSWSNFALKEARVKKSIILLDFYIHHKWGWGWKRRRIWRHYSWKRSELCIFLWTLIKYFSLVNFTEYNMKIFNFLTTITINNQLLKIKQHYF